jgi:hypothetical protein
MHMAQISITLASALSVAFTLSGAGSTVTIGPPAPVVVTELSEFMRGPPGPAAASYPGKTMVWNQGVLSEVRLYDGDGDGYGDGFGTITLARPGRRR